MRSLFPRAQRPIQLAAAFLALAFVASACGGRSDASPDPSMGAILQVSMPGGVTSDVLAKVRAVPGVSTATAVTIAPVLVQTAAGRTAELRVAEVEPMAFEELAPMLIGTGNVAGPLSDGAVVLSTDRRDSLSLRSGEQLIVRPAHGHTAHVPVAAIDSAEAPFADGIVAFGHASWLTGMKPTLLFIGLDPNADQSLIAGALASKISTGVSFTGPRPSLAAGRSASRLFGTFTYVVHPNGTISMSPGWISANIRWRTVPILGRVRCHRLMLPQLARALREIQLRHLAGLIDVRDFHSAGGCFMARTIMWDPKNPPSMHAWGLAIDINVRNNPYGARPSQDPRLVAIFKKWGFRWGGDWATPDGMHFELASLMSF